MTSATPSIRFCNASDGVGIAYATTGTGYPIVRAPNWMNHLEFDWKSPIWRPWLLEMVKNYSLTQYDARGCGLSDRDVEDLSFETNLRDLEAVVDAAGLKRFAILGMCQGAAFALAYAAQHPERVSHLIIYGGYVRGTLKRNPSPKATEEAQLLVKLIELGWGRDDSAFRQVFSTQFIPDSTLHQLQCFNELQRITTSPETAARLLKEFQAIDVSENARRVACPTLVMHSRGDARVPFEEGRLLAGLIPGAEFVPLDSRNHILLNHQPASRQFFEEISRFLQGHRIEPHPQEACFFELTDREREVLELIASGMDNTQIASRLLLNPKTVRNHINNIFGKLNAPNRAQAIVRAREAGFGQKQVARSA
jgi:pimeloyl-ACP methyl ester carboxylesterase/DNA-binding CsgD family transcriptional regulator